jgi:hypothetical protein
VEDEIARADSPGLKHLLHVSQEPLLELRVDWVNLRAVESDGFEETDWMRATLEGLVVNQQHCQRIQLCFRTTERALQPYAASSWHLRRAKPFVCLRVV